MMSKKDFIAMADYIRTSDVKFKEGQLEVLAAFCKAQNSRFLRERWLGYIHGLNGPNGGKKSNAHHI